MTFAATVFIGTSLDGYIARSNDDIEWLTSRGEKAVVRRCAGRRPGTWRQPPSTT
ncbi:hypothetical protein [Streptomyces narbonensis]